jgi:hypothetical protein
MNLRIPCKDEDNIRMALYVDQIVLALDRKNLVILCKEMCFKMWPSEVERPIFAHQYFGYFFPFSIPHIP